VPAPIFIGCERAADVLVILNPVGVKNPGYSDRDAYLKVCCAITSFSMTINEINKKALTGFDV
jgi:hypothetical protein